MRFMYKQIYKELIKQHGQLVFKDDKHYLKRHGSFDRLGVLDGDIDVDQLYIKHGMF